jgi:hypothetical protein
MGPAEVGGYECVSGGGKSEGGVFEGFVQKGVSAGRSCFDIVNSTTPRFHVVSSLLSLLYMRRCVDASMRRCVIASLLTISLGGSRARNHPDCQ